MTTGLNLTKQNKLNSSSSDVDIDAGVVDRVMRDLLSEKAPLPHELTLDETGRISAPQKLIDELRRKDVPVLASPTAYG